MLSRFLGRATEDNSCLAVCPKYISIEGPNDRSSGSYISLPTIIDRDKALVLKRKETRI
jgi:hypothetical protein